MVESTESSLNDDLVVRDFRLWFVGFQSGHFASHIAKLYIRFLLDGQNQDCILNGCSLLEEEMAHQLVVVISIYYLLLVILACRHTTE